MLTLVFRSFEYEIASYSQHYIRPPCGDVHSHMLSCISGPLAGVDTKMIHLVCDDYNNARHHYEEIDIHKYQTFLGWLNSLRVSLRANKIARQHPSPLPAPVQTMLESPRKHYGRGCNSLWAAASGGKSDTKWTNSATSSSKRHAIVHPNKTVSFSLTAGHKPTCTCFKCA